MSIDRPDRPARTNRRQDERALRQVQRALRGLPATDDAWQLLDLEHPRVQTMLDDMNRPPFLKPADDPEVRRMLRDLEGAEP